MAKRYRSRKRFRKRPFKRRRKRNATSNAMSIISKSPIGRSFFTSHKYVQSVALDPTTPAFSAGYIFSLNGMYDPNITGVGHQPMGFDTFTAMYDHYRVFAAHVKVTFSNRDVTSAYKVGLSLRDSNVLDLDMDRSIENGLCKNTTLGPASSGSGVRTLMLKSKTSQFFSRKVTQDDEFKGSISTNPTEQYYLHLMAEPVINGVEGTGVQCQIEIVYFAKWEEPKSLAQS